ncbi:hypothetical protein EV191_1321 [Tamaricihabitans halophyticus]|uniref:Uncharacterized protein n=1 Tax=Tamaricihabitans halophyticus TaxID=1262583 RepID=A0A4R2PY77_9PSEU|nr:hypothetical protein EV191_1321 [Tamaricihabitans halophyticus]
MVALGFVSLWRAWIWVGGRWSPFRMLFWREVQVAVGSSVGVFAFVAFWQLWHLAFAWRSAVALGGLVELG